MDGNMVIVIMMSLIIIPIIFGIYKYFWSKYEEKKEMEKRIQERKENKK